MVNMEPPQKARRFYRKYCSDCDQHVSKSTWYHHRASCDEVRFTQSASVQNQSEIDIVLFITACRLLSQ